MDGWYYNFTHFLVDPFTSVCGSRMLASSDDIWMFGSDLIVMRHKFIILASQ
jgi:hypothetical protein